MSKEDMPEKSEYEANLREAILLAESTLSESAAVDLRRRLNIAHSVLATLGVALPKLHALNAEMFERKKSRFHLFAPLLNLALAFVIYFSLSDSAPGRAIDVNVAILTLIIWHSGTASIAESRSPLEKQLAELERTKAEMNFQWRAAGGTDLRLVELARLVDPARYDIDTDSGAYGLWWYEMKADLLNGVLGETPGFGDWRPRHLSW